MNRLSLTATTVLLTCAAMPAAAVIVQPTVGETLPADLPTGAVGKWGGNAAAVAIAPNYILTTRHQDGSDALRNVIFDGVTYQSVEQWFFDPPGDTVDLRLVRIEKNGADANLTDYASLYEGNLLTDNTIALGGYGPTIGDFNVDGYDWAGNQNNNNALTFGQNRIDAVGVLGNGTYAGMAVLQATFEEAGTLGAVDFEATLGIGDSGGGWFIHDGGEWKLLGLTHGVDPDAAGDFTADAFFGQRMFAVDVRAYADQINIVVPEPTSAALLAGLSLVLIRRRRAA